jgi:AcrR family transcriptional regulator
VTQPERPDGPPARRTRLSPEARKQEVLAEAILYFADEGFDGGTRGLAKRMGITQPLLYRYFPSKDDLVNEVYRAVYLDRWQNGWEDTIRDRSLPIDTRLTRFYQSYTSTVFDRNWLRIFFFAGLKGLDLNARYLHRVESVLLAPIWAETSAAFGQPAPAVTGTHDLVWQMHGAIFYRFTATVRSASTKRSRWP